MNGLVANQNTVHSCYRDMTSLHYRNRIEHNTDCSNRQRAMPFFFCSSSIHFNLNLNSTESSPLVSLDAISGGVYYLFPPSNVPTQWFDRAHTHRFRTVNSKTKSLFAIHDFLPNIVLTSRWAPGYNTHRPPQSSLSKVFSIFPKKDKALNLNFNTFR